MCRGRIRPPKILIERRNPFFLTPNPLNSAPPPSLRAASSAGKRRFLGKIALVWVTLCLGARRLGELLKGQRRLGGGWRWGLLRSPWRRFGCRIGLPGCGRSPSWRRRSLAGGTRAHPDGAEALGKPDRKKLRGGAAPLIAEQRRERDSGENGGGRGLARAHIGQSRGSHWSAPPAGPPSIG